MSFRFAQRHGNLLVQGIDYRRPEDHGTGLIPFIPPCRKSNVPPGDCHVASLLAMTYFFVVPIYCTAQKPQRLRRGHAPALRGAGIVVVLHKNCHHALWAITKGNSHIFWINSTSFERYCNVFWDLLQYAQDGLGPVWPARMPNLLLEEDSMKKLLALLLAPVPTATLPTTPP